VPTVEQPATGWDADAVNARWLGGLSGWSWPVKLAVLLLPAALVGGVLLSQSQAAQDAQWEARKRIYHAYQLAKQERARHGGEFTTGSFSPRDLIMALKSSGLEVTAGRDGDGDGVVDAGDSDGELALLADGGRLSIAEHAGGRTIALVAGPNGFTFTR
jgi:hypothetical protein